MSTLYKFSVPGVACGACAIPVQNVKPDKITLENAYVNIADKTVTFKVADTELPEAEVKKQLIAAVDDVGFECLEIQKTLPPLATAEPQPSFLSHLLKGILGIIAGSVLLGLCIAGLGLPLLAMLGIGIVATLLTFYLGKESYAEAAVGLFKYGRVSMDTLFSISTLIALGVSLISLFIPGLPMMFDAALLIFGFRHVGKAVEESIKTKIEKKLNFRSRAPLEIEMEMPSGQLKKTAVKDLLPNEFIIVRRGEIIPVDGTCETEKAKLYTTIITGKTLPQTVKKGDYLYAGSTVPDDIDYIKIKVQKPEAESYLARLDTCLNQPGLEAPIEKWANNIMKYFVPIVLGVALISAIIIGVLFSPLTAIQCAVAILVSACPCTFGLITPLAVKIGIIKAAADGVRFKSGEGLQTAAKATVAIIDLNGTLTTGIPEVSAGKKGIPATNIPLPMLDYLAAIEQQSSHPFAAAIRQYVYKARKRSADDINLKINHLDRSNHSGLIADIEGETFIVGNRSMMLAQGFSEKEIQAAEIQNHASEHIVYFARKGKILGSILLHDPLRKDAKATIDGLKSQGIEVHMCTGADEKTAKKYAALLGIEKICADCISDSTDPAVKTKTRYVDERIREGHIVVMIGDAANDLPAIKKSHLGIAVQSNSNELLLQQEAGAVIMNVNNQLSLRPILTAFAVGKQTMNNIQQNLVFSLSYNMLAVIAVCGLIVGIGFILNPALGAALMVLQALLILANTYRFQEQKIEYANDAVQAKTSEPEDSSTQNIYQAFKISPQNTSQLNKALADPRMEPKPAAGVALKPAPNPGKRYSSDDLQLKMRLGG